LEKGKFADFKGNLHKKSRKICFLERKLRVKALMFYSYAKKCKIRKKCKMPFSLVLALVIYVY